MVSIIQSIIVIAVGLVLLNGVYDGAVSESITDIATSDEKQEMRSSLYCVTGLLLWPPSTYIFGIPIPIPSFDDLLIAAVITGFILVVLNLINTQHTWKQSLLLYVVVWVTLKYMGLFLIKVSGPSCELMLADMAGLLSGVYTLSAALGLGALYKVVKVVRGV